MTKQYNLDNIQKLLNIGFTETELRLFCLNTPGFKDIHGDFVDDDKKSHIILRIIEHGDRKGSLETLLAWAKSKNPQKFTEFAPYLNDIEKPSSPLTNNQITGSLSQQPDSVIFGRWAALIGIVGVLVALIIGAIQIFVTVNPPNPAPTDAETFTYVVRVEDKNTGDPIINAQVIIEVVGQAPLDGFTDSLGIARILIAADQAGQPGRLIVKSGLDYEEFRQEIDLTEGVLPHVIQLVPLF